MRASPFVVVGAAISVLLVACRDSHLFEPPSSRPNPGAPSRSLAAAEPQRGCATLNVTVSGPSVSIDSSHSGGCGSLRIVVGTPSTDGKHGAVLLPLSIRNTSSQPVRDPAALYAWEDSLAVTSPPGLANNPHTADYLTLLGADSTRATGAPFAGAAVYKLDTLLGADAAHRTLAAGATSRARTIAIDVKNGVHSFTVTIWADAAPAVIPVPALPPAQIPQFTEADIIPPGGIFIDSIIRGAIQVEFFEGTSQALRQAAADAVHGQVIGGQPVVDGDGFYYLRVPDDGTEAAVSTALDVLDTMPQVEVAMPIYIGRNSVAYLKPIDGNPDFRTWRTDTTRTSGLNWGLERVRAPLAWGCSVGSTSTRVGVLDEGLATHARTQPNFILTDLSRNAAFVSSSDQQAITHGTEVASVLGARGNDSVGMTGVMWRAGLDLVDYLSDPAHPGTHFPLLIPNHPGAATYAALTQAHFIQIAARGASIINISRYLFWSRPPSSFSLSDIRAVHEYANVYSGAIRRAAARGSRPLAVISAGNQSLDAFWGGAPSIRDAFPDQVIVVGASDSLNQRWVFGPMSGSNRGSLVDVYAPGDGVGVLVGQVDDHIGRNTGTSFAAPIVSGIAGLAKSLDPSLDAAALKRLIIEAASRRNVAIENGAFLADAYETLKGVARRQGGPICGNHIFIDATGHLTVERTTGPGSFVDDRISGGDLTTGFPLDANLVNVLHDGHYLDVFDGVQAFTLHFDNNTWSRIPYDPDSSAARHPSATSGLLGSSHNGDTSLVATQDTREPNPTFHFGVIDSAGVRHNIGTLQNGIITGASYPLNGPEIFFTSNPHVASGLAPELIFAMNVQTGAVRTVSTRDAGSLGSFILASESGEELVISYTGPFPAFDKCFVEYRSLPNLALLRKLTLPQQQGCAGGVARQVISTSKSPPRPKTP